MIPTRRKRARSASATEGPSPSHQQAAIALPKPLFGGGTSVMKALRNRRTVRDIRSRGVPLQVLSNLLWAACGVNRREGPFGISGRTAASASNSQEIDLYVVLPEGAYRYDAIAHRLDLVADGDLRALTIGPGQAGAAMSAPVHLVYIADVDRLANTSGYREPGLRDPDVQKSYYYVDTGLIAGNVYLFAASYGLASWFHNCNKPALAAALKLRADQRVLFGHTIGYPAKE